MTDEQARWTETIRQRLAVCTQAGDARKAEEYANCYTEDGVLELETRTIAGRDEILAWMCAPSVFPQPANGAPGFVSHHLTTCHIAFSGGNAATVRTYWLVTSAAGLDHNGFYVDTLRREGDAWLIAHRRPRTLWFAPDSVLRI
ncbi:nuclear transport factor 2 family protein [Novosphingobium sp. M1R2S20]|uniref:Nuclear transport factor 2 family protein n=1 Tax=Novosphingobium rhizovicinum TaxID=3228928 RepID=A0ABV3RAN8_9SPHN